MSFIESLLWYDKHPMDNLPVIVDLEHVEAVSKSHLGDDYSLLHMGSGERITIKKSYNEVKAEFVRKLYKGEA